MATGMTPRLEKRAEFLAAKFNLSLEQTRIWIEQNPQRSLRPMLPSVLADLRSAAGEPRCVICSEPQKNWCPKRLMRGDVCFREKRSKAHAKARLELPADLRGENVEIEE